VLQIKNESPFKAALSMLADRDGIDTLFAIVKGTFTLDPTPRLAEEQVPVTMAPEHHGDPATTSIKRPSDVSLQKPGTDVVLLGSAHAPEGRTTRVMDASLAVASVQKSTRVFGDRMWVSNGATYAPTEPEAFSAMPLVWERAFGGKDRTEKGPAEEARNPLGTGFRTGSGLEPVDGMRLPNLEDPSDLITSWKQTPTPSCFAPTAAHWMPRRAYAGTYDEAWQQTRAPYLPKDFDPRFLQIAPPGLVVSGHLQGGEPIELRGLTPSEYVRSRLPIVTLKVAFHLDGTPNERPARLDTVVLEPDAGRVSLVWRAAMACDKNVLKVSHVSVALLAVA
jgi:hypothetical protein